MAAELWAVLTALCWAFGSFFEKKGVRLGGFSPVLGAAIRTTVSVLVLAAMSYPFWRQLKDAGPKPILMVAISGGVFSGALGIMFLYFALNGGNLSIVLPIAFCLTPVIGVVLGVIFMKETMNTYQFLGILLTIIGATMTAYFREHG
ncbi:EamA family transporter [bacterium]|nr:EamA family transporter [candidate division CSSED10-310 bacterium]